MSNHQLASGARSRRRRSWTIFGTVATIALGASLVAALQSSGPTSAGMVLLGGLVVVGIAAALMHAIVSPFPDGGATRHSTGGFAAGGGAGDFGGGGDCG